MSPNRPRTRARVLTAALLGGALAALSAVTAVTAVTASPASAHDGTTHDAPLPLRVDFGPAGGTPASGYVVDGGEAFDTERGYGWVDPSTSAPQDMTAWARVRNKETDHRTDTLVHMQPKASPAAAWQAAVDDGRYSVTVGVGDASYVDSVHSVQVEGTSAISGFTPTSTRRHASATVVVDVVDGLLALTSSGGTNTKLEYVTVDAVGPAPTPVALPAQVDFVPAGTSAAGGSTADVGAPFDSATGRGWVAATSSAPQDMTAWGRERNASGAGRFDDFVHMQPAKGSPARWELAVPTGRYRVTVGVGDPSYTDSTHRVLAEGAVVVAGFTPTTSQRYATGTVDVDVSDGRLTLSPTGGSNTKISFVDVAVAPTSPSPTGNPPSGYSWTTGAKPPLTRVEAGSAVVGADLWVIGGFIDSTFRPTARVDVFDMTSGTWRAGPTAPIGITHAGITTVGTDIWVAGGYVAPAGQSQVFGTRDVRVLDTVTGTWRLGPSLPQARGSGALLALGSTLHFFGGADLSRVDRTEHWSLDLGAAGATWTAGAPLPNARSHMGYAVLGGKGYAVGGQHGVDGDLVTQGDVSVLDPATGTWSAGPSLPAGRSHIGGSTLVVDGRLLVIGGELAHQVRTASILRLDPVAGAWVSSGALPAARYSGAAGARNGTLTHTGGSLSSSETWRGAPQP